MPCPDLLRPGPGVTNARPRQRLFTFRDRILRDHQRIISTYLSLGTRSGPKEIYRTKTIRVTHPPFRESRVWGTDVVGSKYCSHNASLRNRAGCMGTVQ